MPNTNTIIQFKRSTSNKATLADEPLQFGEPLFFEQDDSKNKYLAIGNGDKVPSATFFEGITNTDLLGKTVYADENNIAITNDGTTVGVSKIIATQAPISISNTEKYYLISVNNETVYYHNSNDRGIYVTGNGVLTGGAWNDYAEKRICAEDVIPGSVVCEDGKGSLTLSMKKLQAVPYVVSDTYGMLLGNPDGIPVAVAGRVLVFVDCEVQVGDVVCAGPQGKATVMTRQEIINYPDRILGVVSEIPIYETWNDVNVNGRIWITLK